MNLTERFWAKVDVRGIDECWLWTGSKTWGGYGTLGFTRDSAWGGREETTTTAHRYAYQLLVGPIPEGYEVDHLCRVKHCVNPAHLEAVTRLENIRREWAARRLLSPTASEAVS